MAGRRRGNRFFLLALGLLMLMLPRVSHSQAPATVDTTVAAGEADADERRRKLVKWNEYDGPITTVHFGFAVGLDFAAYSQDEESKEQFDLPSDIAVRDFRLLLRGKFKTQRPITWTLSYMYDGADDEWRFRQTGVMVGVPEISSRFFIGRAKEGYSLLKVMGGYDTWCMERYPAADAFVPILADGIKWMLYVPRSRVHLSLGYFNDLLSENEKFATADNQVVTRLAWQPKLSEAEAEVMHLGVMARIAEVDEGSLQVKARPEAFLAPLFLDTGRITADEAETIGAEAYYRKGPWLYGGEYNWQVVHASNGQDPLFHGGDALVAWLITGETRRYNAPGAYFEEVSPTRSVFEGGPGAWEAVLHLSYSDFDDRSFRGGTFWRLTPMVNWHLTDYLRADFAYGYGRLDRFDLTGGTQFFQARTQLLF